jgi:RNA polymerase sigma-32 factor
MPSWHSHYASAKINETEGGNKQMTSALTIPTPAIPTGSSESYMAAVLRIPKLSREDEEALANRFHQQNDLNAARQLVVANLRSVVHIARTYGGYGLALPDLIQEGNIGLMKAVKRFDPAVGVRLISFAVHWIRAEIHEFVIKNWRIVKVATTKSQRKLFFNLRKNKKHLGWLNKDEASALADDLDVSLKTVTEMESRLSGRDIAFDGYNDDDEASNSPSLYLEDNSANPALLVEGRDSDSSDKELLYSAIQQLDSRSQSILSRRWLSDNKPTLHELAAEYSVSAERIRQIEQQAMKKIKAQLEEAA